MRAEQLCATNKFTHNGWKNSFKGYGGLIAENLVKYPIVKKQSTKESATAIQKALMASPTHKANIVNPQFTRIGIGTACDVTVYLFWSGVKK